VALCAVGTRFRVGFTPHSFRKSVGTVLAGSQGMAAASAQLGHSSELVTSKHYVQRTLEAPDHSEVLQEFGQIVDLGPVM
jgi:integrase